MIAASAVGLVFLALGKRVYLLHEGCDEKNRYSLANAQTLFWFWVVLVSWLTLCAFRRDLVPLGATGLGLLGISGGTYVLSTLNHSPKRKAMTQQSSIRSFFRVIASRPGKTDAEPDAISIDRIQMIAWNIVLGLGYMFLTITQLRLPELDPNLLLLMGFSNGSFLALRNQASTS